TARNDDRGVGFVAYYCVAVTGGGSEDLTVGQPRSSKCPMRGVRDRVPTKSPFRKELARRRARRAAPPTPALAEAEAGHVSLGTIDRGVKPVNRRSGRISLDKRIGRIRMLIRLITDHGPVIILKSHLPPAGIPAKESGVSAIRNKRFHTVSHLLGPILV